MARHEGLRIQASRILGMEAAFLEVLDVRLREALKAARVRELDALVLAAAGSSDPLANQAVARHRPHLGRAAPAAGHGGLRLGRSPGRRRGRARLPRRGQAPHRRRVVLPRARPAARPGRRAGRSRPAPWRSPTRSGAHPAVARAILARYAVGAVELVPV